MLSDLHDIWGESGDGMDTGGRDVSCGGCDDVVPAGRDDDYVGSSLAEEVAPITAELRNWWVHKFPVMDKELHKDFTAIADRIDAEHEALRDQLETSERQKESYREDLLAANRQVHASYNDGFDEGFASADDWLTQHEDAMAEHGWYRALDADKQPIKFDDEVEHNGVVAKVLGITFHGTTPPTVCIVRGDCWVEADELRHYHAPTVEDVLRKMADRCYADEDEPRDRDAIVAEYAAKLRLAGDAE